MLRSPRLKKLAWLLAILIVPLAVASWSYRPSTLQIFSMDTGYHLAVGRWIVEHDEVPRQDPFCFTTEGVDWVNLNWLSQIAFYRIYESWGLVGLQALRLALMGLTLFLSWLSLRAARAPPLIGVATLALVTLMLLDWPQIRPRLFTFLLLSLFAWLLARPDPEARLGPWPALWLTLGLLLWNNLHGGFVFGYAVLGADAAGCALSSWWRGGPKLPQRSRWLIGACVVGLLGFGLHAHGFDALFHAATYTERLGSFVIEVTVEVKPANFTTSRGRLLELCLVFGLVGVIWGRQRPRLREVLVTLPFAQLALQMLRGAPLLVLVAAPWVATSWRGVLPAGAARTLSNRLLGPTWRTIGPAILAVGLLQAGMSLAVEGSPGKPNDVENQLWNPRWLPVRPAAYLQGLGGKGRILTGFGYANVLEWALYPERRVHTDGRTDLHAATGALETSNTIFTLAPGWHDVLLELDVEFVLLPRYTNLTHGLAMREKVWSSVYADEHWVLFRRLP